VRMYETPTLTALGSFAERTGRLLAPGFYPDGMGYWDWSPTKLNPGH
jgi:Family of unknown function (DUF5972)